MARYGSNILSIVIFVNMFLSRRGGGLQGSGGIVDSRYEMLNWYANKCSGVCMVGNPPRIYISQRDPTAMQQDFEREPDEEDDVESCAQTGQIKFL